MDKKDWKILIGIIIIFSIFFLLPGPLFYPDGISEETSEELNEKIGWFNLSFISGLDLLNDYAKVHILTCLIPALFIAGAIAVFIRKDKVLKYLGADAKKYISYGVASVSGAILAVCSCTILPLFAGIKKRGAGLGPAITFLFSGPAINVAAIFLTINVLGIEIGLARIIAAITISILVGLTMSILFREQVEKAGLLIQKEIKKGISGPTIILFFLLMIGILIVNGLPLEGLLIEEGLFYGYEKYIIMSLLTLLIIAISISKFPKEIRDSWLTETWNFSKLILPLLFVGVFVAGFVMPLLPEQLIQDLVGKNTVIGNLVASIFGAFMYFSTLTEIPILQALLAKGMHAGPALALLLAGPSLSLPNMLVIRGVLGNKKTAVYIALVIVYSTIAGLIFGGIIG